MVSKNRRHKKKGKGSISSCSQSVLNLFLVLWVRLHPRYISFIITPWFYSHTQLQSFTNLTLLHSILKQVMKSIHSFIHAHSLKTLGLFNFSFRAHPDSSSCFFSCLFISHPLFSLFRHFLIIQLLILFFSYSLLKQHDPSSSHLLLNIRPHLILTLVVSISCTRHTCNFTTTFVRLNR